MSGLLNGKWPASIISYDAESRTCEISIEGQTNGGDDKLRAEIEYPIGDKSRNGVMTEIEILAGDLVWVEFIQGDPRAPLITGWRNPTQGNDLDWRRWHHKNIELKSDEEMKLNSGKTIEIEAGSSILLKVGSTTIKLTPGDIRALADLIYLN